MLHKLRPKRSKCLFLQKSVEYLSYFIDAEGLYSTTGKLAAIVQAPRPKNVSEL